MLLVVLPLLASLAAAELPPPEAHGAQHRQSSGKKSNKKKKSNVASHSRLHARNAVVLSVRPQLLWGLLPEDFEDDSGEVIQDSDDATGWMRGASAGLHLPKLFPKAAAPGVQLEYIEGTLNGVVRGGGFLEDQVDYGFEQWAFGIGLIESGKTRSMRRSKSPTHIHVDAHFGPTWGTLTTTRSALGDRPVQKDFLGPRLDWSVGAGWPITRFGALDLSVAVPMTWVRTTDMAASFPYAGGDDWMFMFQAGFEVGFHLGAG